MRLSESSFPGYLIAGQPAMLGNLIRPERRLPWGGYQRPVPSAESSRSEPQLGHPDANHEKKRSQAQISAEYAPS